MNFERGTMTGTRGVAGFIPIGIPAANFVPEQRKMQSFVCFPEVGFPWNWTARAFALREQTLTGPLWSFVEPSEKQRPKLLFRVPKEEHNLAYEHVNRFVSIPIPSGHESETIREFMTKTLEHMVCREPELEPGHYYSRIWREGYLHSENELYSYQFLSDTSYFTSFTTSLQRIEGLCEALMQLFRVVQPTSDNADTYGYEIRSLILLACTEVECQWRMILEANHYPGSRFSTTDYVKLVKVMRLKEYKLSLKRYPQFGVFSPFEKWESCAPTRSLDWYHAYNKVKHDAENSLSFSRLDFAIAAVAATLVLMIAQFGVWQVRDYFRNPTFDIKEFPCWLPDQWYYEPLPSQPWTEVDCPFLAP